MLMLMLKGDNLQLSPENLEDNIACEIIYDNRIK